jgi:hypothetical protein
MSAANNEPLDAASPDSVEAIQDLPVLEETAAKVVGGSEIISIVIEADLTADLSVENSKFTSLSNASQERHNAAMAAIQNMRG